MFLHTSIFQTFSPASAFAQVIEGLDLQETRLPPHDLDASLELMQRFRDRAIKTYGGFEATSAARAIGATDRSHGHTIPLVSCNLFSSGYLGNDSVASRWVSDFWYRAQVGSNCRCSNARP